MDEFIRKIGELSRLVIDFQARQSENESSSDDQAAREDRQRQDGRDNTNGEGLNYHNTEGSEIAGGIQHSGTGRNIPYRQSRPPPGCSLSSEGLRNKKWLDVLRGGAEGAIDRPIVVLSLFDGIGGVWVALKQLGIRFIGYSSEINPFGVKVVETNFPGVKHLGSVQSIKREHIKEEIDLIIGGFPCQDLSCIGKKVGLHGLRSSLFFEMVRLLYVFQPKWFLVENVASMSWADREEISKYLNIRPSDIDSQVITANRRRRYYWTNIPTPAKVPDELKDDVLDNHLEDATALEQKLGCIMRDNSHVSGNGAIQRVYDNKEKTLRTITVKELESLLGYPSEYTNVNFEGLPRIEYMGAKQNNHRWNLLGNTFSVPVVTYLLSSLVRQTTWNNHVKHQFSDRYKEHECAVMEPGELWALVSDYGIPNWYAIIESTSGDRFDFIPGISKVKKPLAVRVRFLQSVKAENDKWSRGTGFYTEMRETNVQDNYTMFSHRVTTYKKIDNAYFIYPGEGEVWGIYHEELKRADRGIYYVYINKVEIDWTKVNCKTPGLESFAATTVMMQKIATDTYRCTDNVLELRDLSRFCARLSFVRTTVADVFNMDNVIKTRKNLKKLHVPRTALKKSVTQKTKKVNAEEQLAFPRGFGRPRKRKTRDWLVDEDEEEEEEDDDDDDYDDSDWGES